MFHRRVYLLVLLAAGLSCGPAAAEPPGSARPPGSAAAAQAVAPQPVAIPGPEGLVLRALLVLPAGPASGATIIALHGCAGLALPQVPLRLPAREREWAARLTAAGHPVVFPDSFGSRGHGSICGNPGLVDSRTTRRQDAHAAIDWALAQPWSAPGGVVLLGWSHGGSASLAAVGAPLPPGLVRAAIAYYPGCGRFGGWRPAAPTLLLLGGADDWTAPAPCQQLAALGGAEVETYPGAHHGFDRAGQPLRTLTLPRGRMVTVGTDPEGRAASIARVAGFLAAHGRVAR